MLIQWLKKVGSASVETANVQKAAEQSERQKRQDENVVDLPHYVLTREEAQRQQASLRYLVEAGSPTMRREKMKERVRSKVWGVVRDSFALEDAVMVEEITERILDAAEMDPHYAKMFEG